jgi:hypothetical protein
MLGTPLTRDLGPRLVEWAAAHPDTGHLFWVNPNLPERLPSILIDMEVAMKDLEDSSWPDRGSIQGGLRNVLCHWFDSIRDSPAAFYAGFCSEVVQPNDVILTFNYDVSLEREMRRVGLWDANDGYDFHLGISQTKSATKILKLHGSTSWIDKMPGPGFGGAVGAEGMHGVRPVLFPPEFTFLEYDVSVRDPLPPDATVATDRSGSMILPIPNKSLNVRPEFWKHLWSQAERALRFAEEIAIAGYSFPPADQHAWRLIDKNVGREVPISVSSGSATENIECQLRELGFRQVQTEVRYFDDEWISAHRPRTPPSVSMPDNRGVRDSTLLRILKGTSDANIRFSDLQTLLTHLGFDERTKGDHHIFTRDDVAEILNFQPRGAMAKPYQVKQLRKVLVRYKLTEKGE